MDRQRQQQREFTNQLHPDLGDAFGLDAAGVAAMLDVLDEQAQRRIRVGDTETPEESAERELREEAQFDDLLGPGGGQRLRRYWDSMQARRIVNRMNESSAANERVLTAAKERLIEVVHRCTLAEREGWMPSSFQLLAPNLVESPRGRFMLEYAAQTDYYHLQERGFRRMEREAEAFLTAAQLQRFRHSHAEESNSWRAGLADIRRGLGLDPPGVPEAPESVLSGLIRRRVPVAGDVIFAMTVTINRHATTIEQRVLNRTRHEFAGAQDLLVQALPVLYDDGWLDMYVTYLEPLPRALRPLDQSVRIEAQMPQRHDSVEETFQGKRRRYVIRVTALHARRADADRD